MSMLLSLIAIAFFTFVLSILIRQSYNFIFMFFKKPILWAVSMGLVSFVYFFVGSRFNNSFDVVWWSMLLAFIVNMPIRLNNKSKKGADIVVDEVYGEWGIRKGKLQYRIGLASYLVGGILGWVIFYGEIVK